MMGEQDTPERADPDVAYRQAKAAREQSAGDLDRRARAISNARFVVFAIGVLAAYLAFGREAFAPLWVAVPALAFAVLVLLHDRVLRSAGEARRAASFYERGLWHLDGRWPELPVRELEIGGPAHPYADDLDCLGRGSLFQRISTARTRVGEEVLSDWLLRGANPETVRRRQQAVAELRPRLGLREALATLGEDARTGVESAGLADWGEAPAVLASTRLRVAAAVLPAASLALGGAWLQGSLPSLAVVIALSLQAGFAAWLRPRVRRVLQAAEAPVSDLVLLASLLARLEAERFTAPQLLQLQQALLAEGEPASGRIAGLQRWIDLLDARRNQLFAPIAALLLWSTQLAFAIDAWRRHHGPELRRWIAALGEIEALVSLSAYAYERPQDPFPELLDGGPLCFEAQSLGHPLLPGDRCVRNDVALGDALRLLVVSGSNMSGKSTFLRAIGVNAVLAQAGAPVCASRLRLSPVQIGASVQLRDSLLEGQSRFYAEIQRLRVVFELADADGPPVLFLLDEILHGTNAQERRTGAEAVVQGLLAREAGGVVTTHDLALAEVVDRIGSGAANAHFADEVKAGALHFEYRLRPGVAGQGNALALMRAVGLPV